MATTDAFLGTGPGRLAVGFAEPTGDGEVILTPQGRRLKLAIAKRATGGHHLLVHAALDAAQVARLRDGLAAWLGGDGSAEEASP